MTGQILLSEARNVPGELTPASNPDEVRSLQRLIVGFQASSLPGASSVCFFQIGKGRVVDFNRDMHNPGKEKQWMSLVDEGLRFPPTTRFDTRAKKAYLDTNFAQTAEKSRH